MLHLQGVDDQDFNVKLPPSVFAEEQDLPNMYSPELKIPHTLNREYINVIVGATRQMRRQATFFKPNMSDIALAQFAYSLDVIPKKIYNEIESLLSPKTTNLVQRAWKVIYITSLIMNYHVPKFDPQMDD